MERKSCLEPIYYNGQKTITTRWVLTEKFFNGKTKIKAKLVAGDFEEDFSEILKDSPSCTTNRWIDGYATQSI